VIAVQLETSRLIMRPPIESDLDGWAAFDGDEHATAFFGGPKSRAFSWENLATVAGMWALRGCGLFSLIEKSSGRWIGRIGPWTPEGATAEIGWAVLPSVWRQGYAAEGATAAIDWAIDHLGWTQINHCIDAGNAPSIALAQKRGVRWLRSDHDAHGKVMQVYGQTSQQWRARKAGDA
jgi:RimJ/RimL family protein N-acetyltransferase